METEFHYPRLNPLRRRVWQDGDTWSANYRRLNHEWKVSECATREEALEELRKFVGQKVERIDGEYVEVPRKRRWWWPR